MAQFKTGRELWIEQMTAKVTPLVEQRDVPAIVALIAREREDAASYVADRIHWGLGWE